MFANVRKSYKHTIYAAYLSYIMQALINNLPPLLFLIFRDTFGFSLQQITLISTINFAIQLLVDIFGAKYADRIGYRTLIVGGHVASTIGLVGLAFLPFILPNAYAGLLICVFFNAIGGGISEVLVSPIVEACPTDKNKQAAMSLLHSFYCWGCVAVVLLTTVFLKVFGKESWRVLTCLWALLPLFNAGYLMLVPINNLVEEGSGMTIGALFRSGMFWIFALLMVMAGASELAMAQWASAFAEGGLKVSKTMGDILGPCFFAVTMGIARVVFAKLAGKIDLMKYMIGCAALCILAYMIAVFAPWPVVSLLGCGLCGFSVGVMWPGVFSTAQQRMPLGGTAMFALLALFGDLGCSSGPTLVGMVSSAAGDNLKAGLLSAACFPAILIAGVLMLMKQKENKARSKTKSS